MKQGWVTDRFQDVVFLQEGPGIRKYEYQNDGYPMINVRCVQDGFIDMTKSRSANYELATTKWKHFQIEEGDILFTISGTIGRSAIVKKSDLPLLMNTSVVRFRPLTNELDRRFLYHIVRGKKFQDDLINQSTGTAIKNVGPSHLKKITISYPPLPEQKCIVAKLDQAFEAIDKAKANVERNLQNAKDLFQSQLNQIFSKEGGGWVEITLGDLGKVSMCKRIMKHQTSPAGDIPFYKIGTFGETPNAFIDSDTYQEFKQKYSFPKKGAILISASGTIGRRVIYDGEPAYFQDSNIVWIDNNEELVLNEYLYQFYGVCDWNPSKGATISRLYNDDLRRIRISFPNIDEQMELVGIMKKLNEKTQSLIHQYQHQLNNLFEMKNSILQKAFNGELSD